MSEVETQQVLYRLYVPLQASEGEFLTPPADGKLVVLGYTCQINAQPEFKPPPGMVGPRNAVRQSLLFAPLPEADARRLLEELVSRIPVLSFREQVTFHIPHDWVEKDGVHGRHNNNQPALIPEEIESKPIGGSIFSKSDREAAHFLGTRLAECPVVSDDRIRTAIDLANAARHETLTRSRFLTWMTIIDSLADSCTRPDDICDWLEKKIAEAKRFNDRGLSSALSGLKRESRKTAIRNLVERAARTLGEAEDKIQERLGIADDLYDTRSRLSHTGGKPIPAKQIGTSRALCWWILDAVIRFPQIVSQEQ